MGHQAAMVAVGNQLKEIFMTDTTSTSPASKLPTYYAYQVRDREGKKPIWNRLGAAWAHNDGKGFSIQLESLPLDGRISLRDANDRKVQ